MNLWDKTRIPGPADYLALRSLPVNLIEMNVSNVYITPIGARNLLLSNYKYFNCIFVPAELLTLFYKSIKELNRPLHGSSERIRNVVIIAIVFV